MGNKKESKKNISIRKEKCFVKYCKKKGWSQDKLTTRQMLEIVNCDEYKNIS